MSEEQLMDIKAVAKYLRLKESTVYAWAQTGKLPAFRLGRLWRFRQSDLEDWLENKRFRRTKADLHPIQPHSAGT